MEYEFKNKVGAFDFFKMAMANTYKLPLGLVNVIFTVAMVLLTIKFWNTAGDILQCLMFLGCLIFPVMQPFFILLRSKGQAGMIPKDMVLSFDGYGMNVSVQDKRERIAWSALGMSVKKGYVVVFSDQKHGYIINNRMMGKEKEDFIMFLKDHIK